MAVITFGESATVVFDFNELQGTELNLPNLKSKIDTIKQLPGANRLDLALSLANAKMFSVFGGRRDRTPRVINMHFLFYEDAVY